MSDNKEITNMEILNTFSVGDVITIKKFISAWSSSLNSHYHMDDKLKFPYTLKIAEIKYVPESNHVAMTEGKYGWSLTSLVEKGCIDMKKFIRYKKIIKLNEIKL